MIVGSPTILNLVPGGVMKCVHVNQVNKNIEIQFKVMNGAAPYNVPEGVTCTIRGTKGDAFGYAAEAAVTAGSNIITVTLTEQLTAVAGAGNIFELVFVGAADDMKVSTENFILAVERQAMGEDTVISDSDLSYAEQVLDQLQNVAAVNAQVQQNKSNLAAEISRAKAAEAAETAARATQDASLQSQINQLVAPEGSAPSAAEVENARVGADGTVYSTLGDAIRTQGGQLKNAIKRSTAGVDSLLFYSNFRNGTIESGDLKLYGQYRVGSATPISNDRKLVLSIASGYRIALHYLVNGAFSSDSGWKTGTYTIPTGSEFMLMIARVTENTSEIADIPLFLSQVTFSTVIEDEIESIENKNTLQDENIESLRVRVTSLDGYSQITLESGNIGYGWSSLTFSTSNTRMRTPENGGVQVSVGDIITMTSWEENAIYPIIYESDGHYHSFYGWHTSDFTVTESGTLYLIVRKNPERTLTELDVLNVYKKTNVLSSLGERVSTNETAISELKRLKKDTVFPTLVSHGGLEGLYPENTVLGVLGAKKYGYTITEADLRITSDGHFVMCHDETVDRTTDGTGTIASMTLTEVKACNIDKWGAYTYNTWTWDNLKIPTLEEYLNACIWCGITPMIEARDFTESQLDSLITILRQYNLEDVVIVESFIKATINYLRSKSSMRLCALLDATEASVDYCKGIGNCTLAINATSADPTQAFMEYARANSVPITAWTVNAIERIQSLALLGVSQVITDLTIYGNDLSEMYCTSYHPISDINSDVADNWGFRYYVENMLTSWNISGTPLKTIATLSAEIFYDTNKPQLKLCGESVTLADKPGEWQTVMTSKVIQMNSTLTANAGLSLKLAESGNVKMKNAVVKFYNV